LNRQPAAEAPDKHAAMTDVEFIQIEVETKKKIDSTRARQVIEPAR
jgi:hypothetical protein